MGVMESTVHVPGLGDLEHSGRSRQWSGQARPAGTAWSGYLTVDGTSAGPTPSQVSAIHQAFSRWDSILREAEPGLAELLREAELPPVAPWDAFKISGVSVPSEDYDAGVIHVHIDLEHVDYPDEFWPAIDVVDGMVREVLSGT